MRLQDNIRISISLVSLTLLIFFVAKWLDLIPDENESRTRERIVISESLAIQYSAIIQQDILSVIPVTSKIITERNSEIQSIVVRDIKNQIISSYGNPSHNNNEYYSTIDFMRVPIFKNNIPWGFIEISFKPVNENYWWNFYGLSFVRLIVFILCFGFIVYFLLVRKVLRHLDPTKIVPQRVKTTLNAVKDGMVLIDTKERIVLTNDAFELTLHFSGNYLLGKKLSDFPWSQMDESSDHKYRYPWQKTLKKGRIINNIKLGFTTTADKPLLFVVSVTPIKDKQGNVSGALVSFNDMTEVEKINNDLENMTHFLRHEMSNALYGAMGTLSLLEKSKQLSDSDKLVLKRTKRLHGVIKNLLMSVKEAKSIETSFSNEILVPINVEKLLKDIVSNYSDIFIDNTFEFESVGEELIILGYEERFTQMIDKLTTNAIDHSLPNTLICYSCTKDNDRVLINIINEGRSLPEDKQKIFDLFASFREDDNTQNRGIGLYVVKLIANTYGGTVEATEREDVQGAKFTIKLPLLNQGRL